MRPWNGDMHFEKIEWQKKTKEAHLVQSGPFSQCKVYTLTFNTLQRNWSPYQNYFFLNDEITP